MPKIIEVKTESFEREISQHNGVALVDFWAEWCEPCKSMKKTLEDISCRDGQYKITSVDIAKNADLACQWNIMTLPTFIIFKNGKPCGQITGAASEKTIMKALEDAGRRQ